MNTDLLTINNMFVRTTGAAPAPSKPDTSQKTAQYSLIRDDKSPQVNTPETAKTYNTRAESQKEPINKPLEDFRQALRKQTTTEGPCKAQDSTKSREQSANSNTAEQPNVVQTCPAEQSITEHSKKRTATKNEAKTGGQLAQLTANLRAEKSPPVTGRAAKSAEIKLLLTTDKGQLGFKTVLHNTSKGTAIPNTQLGEGKNSGKIPISNNTDVNTKILTNEGNVKELIPELPVSDGSKPAITNTLVVADTGKISVSSTKQLIPESLIDGSSKTNTAGEKTPAANTNAPAVLTKSNQPSSPPIGINPEESAPTAEKSKAAAPQILSESSGGNGKESSHAGNNLSDESIADESIAQKLNITEVQISTGQTKSRSNSSSHNRANSGLDQIFSHNNPQTPITEQSLTSVETAKTTNLQGQSSSSDVSADIGKQIFESIHCSLSQKGGDGHISIRLNPPELGKVLIKFQEQNAQLTGLLEVSKTQTRVEIEQALPQIIRNLMDCGIQIKRLEVVLSNGEQSEQEAFKDQLLQNGGAQQQDSENPSAWGNDPDTSGINEWLTNNNSYPNISELQEALITDGSINMLI
jgi:flagellar hook-length control protein FliK